MSQGESRRRNCFGEIGPARFSQVRCFFLLYWKTGLGTTEAYQMMSKSSSISVAESCVCVAQIPVISHLVDEVA